MAQPTTPSLKRSLGTWAITVYAVGDILGAGIYALVGKVAGQAGSAAWLAFLLASLIAFFTALTYAELASRFPLAGGAVTYCNRAFRKPALAFVVGVFVLSSGVTSAAAVSRAFVGYLTPFLDVPVLPASLTLLVLMSALSYWGIEESSKANLVLTALELTGLLVVVYVGFRFATDVPGEALLERIRPESHGVLGAATLAFFAYIGFEDTANIAEEVKDPGRSLPRAILTAVLLTSVVYAAVTIAALWTVPLETLARSDSPLLEVLRAAGVQPPGHAFSLVALVAICNTGLLNLIMASRLTYGMAREGLLPAALGKVHPVRRTPWLASLAVLALAGMLATTGGAAPLAQTTSLLLVCVFGVLHAALLWVKRRDAEDEPRFFRTPGWTPMVGLLLCGTLLLQYPLHVYLRAAGMLGMAALLHYGVQRWSSPSA